MEAGSGRRAQSENADPFRVAAGNGGDAIEFDEVDEYADDAWCLIGVVEREGRLTLEAGGFD